MGGSTKTQTSNITQNTQTDPWARTVPTLDALVQQVNGNLPYSGPSADESASYAGLTANAKNGNMYAPAINTIAQELLGGGGPDRSGYVAQGMDQLRAQLNPIATQSTDPFQNAAFQNLYSTLSNDTTDAVKSAYAGAGYSPASTGDFSQQLARGLAQGVAPAFVQAQDTLTNQRTNAASSLYQAGANTAGVLSGLDQTRLGDQLQGIGASTAALNANDSAYNRLLQIGQQQRALPLSNIGNLESLIVPMAQLGGTSNTNGTQTTTQNSNPGLLGTMMGIGSLFSGGANSAFGGMLGAGTGLLGGLGWL